MVRQQKITKMKTKTLTEKKCEKCNYTWFAKVEKPRQCPNCKRQIRYEKTTR